MSVDAKPCRSVWNPTPTSPADFAAFVIARAAFRCANMRVRCARRMSARRSERTRRAIAPALTDPIFGNATSRSPTLAVLTHAGGRARISSNPTLPQSGALLPAGRRDDFGLCRYSGVRKLWHLSLLVQRHIAAAQLLN